MIDSKTGAGFLLLALTLDGEFDQAIDIETIRAKVMRGASTATALMIAPGVQGFVPEMNKRLPFDVEAAKKLMADARYPSGFEVSMNCPRPLRSRPLRCRRARARS